jgi:adenosine deaminase
MPDVYDSIPKVELHCHIEGAIRPSTVADLAKKAKKSLPVDDVTELYRYGSLDEFLSIFWFVQEMLTGPEEWERVVYEVVLDAAPHGLAYCEMFFTPARHLASGQDLGAIVAGLTRGIEAAEAETGVRCMLICDMDRAFGGKAGLELVEGLGELRRQGQAQLVIGIGMDSTELGIDLRAYAEAYTLAAQLGLRRTAHAGEDTGPDNIQMALDVLGAERIDHGLSILSDPELTRRLADARIPLTVCPNSNVIIANKVPHLEDHPFAQMREAGLLATLNTDDPAMIGIDLGREYRSVAQALHLDLQQMGAVALDGVEATWLDESDKRDMRSRFQEELRSAVSEGDAT